MPSIITRVTAAPDATVKGLPLTNTEIDQNFINLNNALIATSDLIGFVDKSQSTLSYNSSTRTVTLIPSTGSYDVYYKGKRITINTTLSLTTSTTAGGRYIIYNPTTNTLQDVGTSISVKDYILVAYLYWNSTTAVIFGDERHSAMRDTSWHVSKHAEGGLAWQSGGDVTYTANNSSLIGLSLTNLTVADEDLTFSIVNSASPNGYYQQQLVSGVIPTVYLSGTAYTQTTAASNPWLAGTLARYNSISGGSGSLVDAPEGSYINYWLIATNDMALPVKLLVGRAAHSTLLAAYQEVIDASETYGLPFEECAVMYQVTLQTSSAYTGNTSRVQIVSVRKMATASDATVVSHINGLTHAGLSKLSNDDHQQYIHISNSRTISAAHTFNGVQTFSNGIKINTKPVVGLDGANKNYVDQQALLMAFLNS